MNSNEVPEDSLNLVSVEGRVTVSDGQRSVTLKTGDSSTVSCSKSVGIENSSTLPAIVIRTRQIG